LKGRLSYAVVAVIHFNGATGKAYVIQESRQKNRAAFNEDPPVRILHG
jgi:hypothetical protein